MKKNAKRYVITLDGDKFWGRTGMWWHESALAKTFASSHEALAEIKACALRERYGKFAVTVKVAR
jgi:hypothetical protein